MEADEVVEGGEGDGVGLPAGEAMAGQVELAEGAADRGGGEARGEGGPFVLAGFNGHEVGEGSGAKGELDVGEFARLEGNRLKSDLAEQVQDIVLATGEGVGVWNYISAISDSGFKTRDKLRPIWLVGDVVAE